MAEEFLSNPFEGSNPPDAFRVNPAANREPIKVLIIGSRPGIHLIIHQLHHMGLAQANEWSPLMPEPNSGQFLSIVIKFVELG